MTPTLPAIRSQIQHMEAACMGIEDAIQIRERLESAGKRTDALNPVRQLRLNGFRQVLDTLRWLEATLERRAAA